MNELTNSEITTFSNGRYEFSVGDKVKFNEDHDSFKDGKCIYTIEQFHESDSGILVIMKERPVTAYINIDWLVPADDNCGYLTEDDDFQYRPLTEVEHLSSPGYICKHDFKPGEWVRFIGRNTHLSIKYGEIYQIASSTMTHVSVTYPTDDKRCQSATSISEYTNFERPNPVAPVAPILVIDDKSATAYQKRDIIFAELEEAFGNDFKCLVCGEKIVPTKQPYSISVARKTTRVSFTLSCHTPKGQTEQIVFTKKKGIWTVDQKCLPQFELRKTGGSTTKFDMKQTKRQLFAEVKKYYGDGFVCPICGEEIQYDTDRATKENYSSFRARTKTWFRNRPSMKFWLSCHRRGYMNGHYIRFEKLKTGEWRIHKLKV